MAAGDAAEAAAAAAPVIASQAAACTPGAAKPGPGHKRDLHQSERGPKWPCENGTICPFGLFFPCSIEFLAQFEANPCSEASCGVVTFSLVL